MQVAIVHVRIKAEHVSDFIEATRKNHEASIREAGNLRFDVLQLVEDPTRFVLYEAYGSAEQAAAHKNTVHYQAWRKTVSDWMVEPRVGVAYIGLYPRRP